MTQRNGHVHSLDQLQAFADGTLDHARARDIERHLADCGECRATVDRLRALAAEIERAESADAPSGYFDTFGSRVASRIAAAKRPAPLPRRLRLAWWGLVPAAAAAVLALVVSLDNEPRTAVRQLVRIPAPEVLTTGDWPSPDEVAAGGDRREQAGTRDDAIAAPASPAMTPPAAAPPQPAALALSEAKDKEEAAGGVRAMKRTAAKSSPAAAMEHDRAEAAPAGQSAPAAEGTAAPAPVAAAAPGTAVTLAPAGPPVIMAAKDAPAPVFEQPPVPREVGEVRVIVIHLPDGASFCPAPEIASAIAIGMPRPAGAASRVRER